MSNDSLGISADEASDIVGLPWHADVRDRLGVLYTRSIRVLAALIKSGDVDKERVTELVDKS